MGLLTKNLCVVCGRPVKMFSKTAEIKEGTVCENCLNREFTTMFMDTHADMYFDMKKLPDYRKYRAENQKLVKNFNESCAFFDIFHMDEGAGLMIVNKGSIDHTLMHSEPLQTGYDVIPLGDIIYMDYVYDYIDINRETFRDYLICNIKVLIITKSKWYPYAFYAPIAENVKLQIKINEEEFNDIIENDEDLDDHVFQIIESGEFLRFRQFIEEHMSQTYLRLQKMFREPERESIPDKYEPYTTYFFKKIKAMKKLDVFDKGYYKHFLEKTVINDRLQNKIEDKYW